MLITPGNPGPGEVQVHVCAMQSFAFMPRPISLRFDIQSNLSKGRLSNVLTELCITLLHILCEMCQNGVSQTALINAFDNIIIISIATVEHMPPARRGFKRQ